MGDIASNAAGRGPDPSAPLVAIGRRCATCHGHDPMAATVCRQRTCPLHAVRLGRKVAGIRPLKQIREMCVACMNGQSRLVADCASKTCPIQPYRMGENPPSAGRKDSTAGFSGPANGGLGLPGRPKPTKQKSL